MMRFAPLLAKMGVENQRQGQDRLGNLLGVSARRRVKITEIPLPTGIGVRTTPGVWVTPAEGIPLGVDDCAILYLHGGGYVTGGTPYVSGVAARLCERLSLPVFAPVYRLAPENPFPAAPEDALAAWDHLLTMGYDPSRIILCGESAGGGLCLALCLMLKEANRPLPAGQILFSPWVDLSHSGESITANAATDPTLTLERLEFFAKSYCGTHEDMRKNPLCSPLFADLSALPPTLIFAGDAEILYSDAVRLCNALRSAGSKAALRTAPKLWHAYTLYPIDEAEDDFKIMTRFIRKRALEWSKL